MDFFTQYGENRPKGSKQRFVGPSMTEPDNTMSIPEIIARFTRGQGIQVTQYPWATGVAQEENEVNKDGTLADVLGLQKNPSAEEPAKPEPSAPAASAAAPAAAAEPSAPAPAPSAGA